VFTHREHISRIRSTWHTIFNQWLPASGYSIADAPDFESYSEDFDPHTGTGVVEIWIPIK
jgi:AraC family transcriptional regulator